MKRLAATVLLSLVGCAGARPTPTPPPAAATPEVPLPSPAPAALRFGGRVVTLPSPGLPLVSIRVAFQAGSVDDPPGKEGLTSLTADLLSQGGTRELSSAQLLEALFPMAAGIGTYTDKELTVFLGTVHRDHAERYIELLVAALARPRLDPREFERLREDAVQGIEKGLRSGNDEALGKASLDLLIWKGHPYAHYVGGTVQGLRSLTLEDCRAQAARVFTRDRMLIGIAGATDERFVAALTSGLEALPVSGAPPVALPAPTREGPRALLVQKAAESTAISMGYPYALQRGDPDFHPMMVAVSALGEHRQFNGRLMRELRVKRGLNYGNYAYVEHFAQEGGSTLAALNVARRQQAFTVWLRPVASENATFAVRAALHQLERFREGGMTQDELDATRGFLEGYTLLWGQTPMRRLGYAMDDVFYGTTDHLASFRASLATMTLEQVNAAIRRWIAPGALRMALVSGDAGALGQALASGEPSPIRYAAEEPDPEVLAEDARFIGSPLGLPASSLETRRSSELFER